MQKNVSHYYLTMFCAFKDAEYSALLTICNFELNIPTNAYECYLTFLHKMISRQKSH